MKTSFCSNAVFKTWYFAHVPATLNMHSVKWSVYWWCLTSAFGHIHNYPNYIYFCNHLFYMRLYPLESGWFGMDFLLTLFFNVFVEEGNCFDWVNNTLFVTWLLIFTSFTCEHKQFVQNKTSRSPEESGLSLWNTQTASYMQFVWYETSCNRRRV